jgi:uncharacterized protein YndB with AHSA1/START domain
MTRRATILAALVAALVAVALPGADAAPATDPSAPAEAEAIAAGGAGAAPADDEDGVRVQVNRGPSGLEVEARCLVEAPVAVVWEVLTDYDGIDRFVSSMRESRVSGRGENHVLVEQVALGRLLFFRRKLHATLFVEETPRTSIRFEDVLGKDFESYRGEWRIEEESGRVAIVYRVGARPSFSIPDFVARGLFRRTARDLLSQVRDEIERRAARPGVAIDAGGRTW